ncbi:Fic family protein [Leptotrichia buccalis]|uniref:Filamentation induced by cAMP protein Fic n=1 Tax=Leptotrichia buccalis (strain ATCC 14201 / DSM 1135 / JCM 12969 / NCTC 10249 / C-1013-b) TaxID=523794 RepID=C7NBS0_LEPBD|nr:Fic family protein [Leptotrichia buccalis]ACV39601.1 filamentation induced by cAMP protein Fic [Leptotrichia buccalis C-1013-b]
MDITKINYEYFLDLSVRMTHHSNAIEGNTLTLNETATIILDSIIPGSKSVREVFEVLNHKRAIDYMISELENDKKLDIYVIKSINKEILDRLNDNAGNFKRNSNAIIGVNFETSTPSQAPILTKNWIENLNYRLELCKNEDEKLLEILNSHIEFERIHPFSDGNGRTGRLIMMYLCFQEKISPFVIEKEDRALYMSYLREQNVDIIFEKVKELQKFEQKRIEKF